MGFIGQTPHNRTPDEIREQVVIHIAATGESYAATGRRYGISKTTVRQIAMEHSVRPVPLQIADEIDQCDYLPTLSEIRAEVAAIQATWSPSERWKRMVGKPDVARPERGTVELSVYTLARRGSKVVGIDRVG